MEILGIYNDLSEIYVKKMVDQLIQDGYAAYTAHLNDYSYELQIDNTPSFVAIKARKAGYLIQGMKPYGEILEWANQL